MAYTNPYQIPKSDLEVAVDKTFSDVKLFSVAGRLGRLRYLGYSFALTLLVWVTMASLGFMAHILPGNLALPVTLLIMGAAYIFMLVVGFMLSIQRLHDMNASAWWCLLFLVPVVNMVMGLVLLFAPGTKGPNQFGNPTPPNTKGVIVLASIVPIVLVVGIVAAVAIPAYHNYAGQAHETSLSQLQ